MRVAHLSDLHLGHGAAGPGRRRGRDVLRAFGEAASRIGDEAPALVVVAGDVFDDPLAGAPALAAFVRGVRDLRGRAPGVVIGVVAGLRDTPVESGRQGPLEVVSALDGVEVAISAARRLRLEEHDASVTLAPHLAWAGSGAGELVAEPDPDAKWNVLVGYADLAANGRAAAVAVRPGQWDYVALGSRHAREQVAERVHYSGSLERIGADPWAEAVDEKGFLVADLRSGSVDFRPVPTRAVVSLAPVDAGSGGPVAVARRLAEAVAGVPGGVEDRLVRVPVRGLGPDDFAAFDHDALAPLRRRTAGLRVDALPAAQGKAAARRGGPAEPGDAVPAAGRGRAPKAGAGRSGAAKAVAPQARNATDAGAAPMAATDPPTLADLQALGFGGPPVDLGGARGLVALVGGGESPWNAVADWLCAALATPGNRGSGRGSLPVDRTAERLEAAWRGTPLKRLAAEALAGAGLGGPEYAAVWFGAGPAETWLSAGAALAREPGSADGEQIAEPAANESGGRRSGRPPAALARWFRRLVRETERDVARLEESQAGTDEMKARLARLREDAAEIQGDLEAATMNWVRARQDAETRLLLHRDRARELKEKLKEMERAGRDAAGGAEPAGGLADAMKARRDEWDSVVRDGQWWRRRRDQLEDKPPEIKAAETRKLETESEIDSLSEDIERRRVQARELKYAQRRLHDLQGAGARIAPPGTPGSGSADDPPSGAAERFRERVHAKAVTITGGRVAGAFPELFAGWAEGGLRNGSDAAALELAARIALAELAVEADAPLGSVLLPRTLGALRGEDVARALAALAALAQRVALVLVGAPRRVVAAAPESFDFLLWANDGLDGRPSPTARRLRPAPARLVQP